MLARRLLASAGGGTSFTPPPPPPAATYTLTSDPHGGWTIPNPAAYYHGGRTFIGWVNATDGSQEIAHYDHATSTLSSIFTLASGLPDEGATDTHNQPSVIARSQDGKLVTAYSGHLDTRVRVRISSNVGDATAWASEQVLDPGYGGVYTYAMLVQLRGLANEPIYLFTRSIPNVGAQVGRLAYAVSTDGGASWSSFSLLFTGGTLKVPYWTIISDYDTRIDVFTSSSGSSSDLYHFYFDGSTAKTYQTDGTEITATRPFVVGDMTQVYNGSGSGGSFALGASWDGTNASLCYVRLVSGGTDNDIWTARWRAGAWTRQQVVSTVGGHHASNAYLPSANVMPFDEDRILIHAKVSGRYESFEYVTADDGASWSGTQLTSSSTHDQMWVMPVFFSTGKMDWVWLDITYTSDTNFDAGIVAYGTG